MWARRRQSALSARAVAARRRFQHEGRFAGSRARRARADNARMKHHEKQRGEKRV